MKRILIACFILIILLAGVLVYLRFFLFDNKQLIGSFPVVRFILPNDFDGVFMIHPDSPDEELTDSHWEQEGDKKILIIYVPEDGRVNLRDFDIVYSWHETEALYESGEIIPDYDKEMMHADDTSKYIFELETRGDDTSWYLIGTEDDPEGYGHSIPYLPGPLIKKPERTITFILPDHTYGSFVIAQPEQDDAEEEVLDTAKFGNLQTIRIVVPMSGHIMVSDSNFLDGGKFRMRARYENGELIQCQGDLNWDLNKLTLWKVSRIMDWKASGGAAPRFGFTLGKDMPDFNANREPTPGLKKE